METFNFPYHTYRTEYPESGSRIQMGGGYIFASPPNGPDLRRFTLNFPTMFYRTNSEVTSTNLLPYSHTLNTYNLNASVVLSQDGTLSPDGIHAANKLTTVSTVSMQAYAAYLTTLPSTNYSFSVYVKKGNNLSATNTIRLRNTTTNTVVATAEINWSNMTITGGGGTSSITPLGDDWYKVVVSTTTPVDPAQNLTAAFGASGGAYAVGHSWYVGGIQLEPLITATGLIYTNGAPVTRTQGQISDTEGFQTNMATLEAFYNRHKLHKTFIYPHPVYGNVEVQFHSPLKIPEGNIGGNGSVKDFTIELVEIIQ